MFQVYRVHVLARARVRVHLDLLQNYCYCHLVFNFKSVVIKHSVNNQYFDPR